MEPLNVLFVLYGSLSSCSGVQVAHFADALTARGHRCHLAAADEPTGSEKEALAALGIGASGNRAVLTEDFAFADGRGPDVIHGWTPRENVRRLCLSLQKLFPRSSLAVHLEDNEIVILSRLLHLPAGLIQRLPAPLLDLLVPARLTNPRRFRPFLESADGVSVIIDRLLDSAPPDRPRALLKPIVDLEHFSPAPRDESLRHALAIGKDETVVVFTGSVHHVNAGEARILYRAVAQANARGVPCRLLRTGMNHCSFLRGRDRDALRHVVELGFLPYDEISRHLALGDLLVQPGRPGPFNDFRLPSKVPEYLAAGRPVALPATNIGLRLKDREEALLLRRGDAAELVEVIRTVRNDRELAARLGAAGRAFAEKHFGRDGIVRELEVFYHDIRHAQHSVRKPRN